MKYTHTFYCKSCGKSVQIQSAFRDKLFAQPNAPWKCFKKRIKDKTGTLIKVKYHFLCEECNDIKEILE